MRASFLSSVLPKDYYRTSIPLSYLNTSVKSTDNVSHSVQFYSDVDASWVAFESNATIQWQFYHGAKPANGSVSATSADSPSIYSWYAPWGWKTESRLLIPFRFVRKTVRVCRRDGRKIRRVLLHVLLETDQQTAAAIGQLHVLDCIRPDGRARL